MCMGVALHALVLMTRSIPSLLETSCTVPNKAVKTKNTILKHSTWRALFNAQH